MEISLIRHGRSKQVENRWLTSREFQHWIAAYDESSIFAEKSYPAAALEKTAAAKLVISSDLLGSIDSARLLNPNKSNISDALFRELELPSFPAIMGLKQRPNSWAVLLRCLWFMGYSRQCESLNPARQRAGEAARQLEGYAEEHQSVVLVGHGFFNRMIARELKKRGWSGKRTSSAQHWGCTTYTYPTQSRNTATEKKGGLNA